MWRGLSCGLAQLLRLARGNPRRRRAKPEIAQPNPVMVSRQIHQGFYRLVRLARPSKFLIFFSFRALVLG
jgi:hypothetical protein